MKELLRYLKSMSRLLLVVALLSPSLSALADSFCDFTVNNVHYKFKKGTTDEVIVSYEEYESGRYGGYYSNYTGIVTIPATVTYNSVTYKVTAVGYGAFAECNNLTSVNLPSTITSIDAYAFGNCQKLTSVNVPPTVTSIGQGAFNGCVALYSVNIPKGVKNIEPSTFYGCKALSSITIPDGVTSIGTLAFYQCSNLSLISIPDDVVSVGADAFYGTSWLSNRPTGLLYVGKVAYKYVGTMPSGTNITIKDGTTEISNTAFSGCSGLESINIPESVTTIGQSAFTNCTSLTAVTIPKSITSIGGDASSSAFYGCTSLKNVTILCPKVGNWWFRSVDAIESVTFGNSVKSIGYAAFYYCKGLTAVTIPESVTSISNEAFYLCTSLATVTIANSQASIAYDAFYGTPWMDNQPDGLIYLGQVAYRYKGEMPEGANVVIKDGTVEIADHAFYYCSGMASVSIPVSVKTIGSYAFSGCSGLTSITLPEGIDSIGSYAFQYCRGLTYISIPGTVRFIGDRLFSGCENLLSAVMCEGLTDVGSYMFQNCTKLESVAIPASVKNINNYAFLSCTALKSIVIPENVITIGNGAFTGCTSLASVSIPPSVISIGQSCFNGCTVLTDVLLPEGLKTIDSNAFRGCTGLTSVAIPSSVTIINDYAFTDCSLTTVTMNAKEPISISSNVFAYYSNYVYYSYANLATLYVPYGSKAAYEAANGWKDFKEIIELIPQPTDISTLADAIYIEPFSGRIGDDVNIEVKLKNAETVTSYGFELVLPEGMSINVTAEKEFDDEVTLNSDRHNKHTVSTNMLDNGNYKVAVASMSSKTLTDNDGLVLTIKANIDKEMAVGDYPIKIENPLIVYSDATKPTVEPTLTTITIEDYTKGDVDGDGTIDLADAVLVINYYVGKTVNKFIAKAADVDGDGVIDLADAVKIINYYVGKIPALAPRLNWNMPEPE